MMFKVLGIGRVIGKTKKNDFFGTNYCVAYEAIVDGQRVTDSKTVKFEEYYDINVGDNIDLTLYSGNGRTVTPSRTDAGLESIFGAFIHPSLRR